MGMKFGLADSHLRGNDGIKLEKKSGAARNSQIFKVCRAASPV
jgi:hypothetical protein